MHARRFTSLGAALVACLPCILPAAAQQASSTQAWPRSTPTEQGLDASPLDHVVIPAHGIVGVVNSWNVFGDRVQGILMPFIDALLTASGVPVASE